MMTDMETSRRKIALVLLGVLLRGVVNAGGIEIVNLLTEYEQTPLAIDTSHPPVLMADDGRLRNARLQANGLPDQSE